MNKIELINMIFTLCTTFFNETENKIYCFEDLTNCAILQTTILSKKEFNKRCAPFLLKERNKND
jgi:hypothetical protein